MKKCNNKKLIIFILFMILLILLFSGCSNKYEKKLLKNKSYYDLFLTAYIFV